MSQCIEHVQGSEKVCTEGPDSLCLPSLFLKKPQSHLLPYGITGIPQKPPRAWLLHILCDPHPVSVRPAGRVLWVYCWHREFPYLFGFPHPVGARAGPEPRLLTLAQMGSPQQSSGLRPEGPLPRRAEATPPPWAVFRDSGRVPSVPGVQSSAWRTFSFSASLEAKRGQRPCPPLISTPEQALSSSHSNSAYRLTTHSHDFQRLLWFRHPGLGNACSGLWNNSAGFFY